MKALERTVIILKGIVKVKAQDTRIKVLEKRIVVLELEQKEDMAEYEYWNPNIFKGGK